LRRFGRGITDLAVCGTTERPAIRSGDAPLLMLCSPVRDKDDDDFEDLGELQREVVQVVWAHAPITAEVVREHLSRPLKESTVRTVLRRLEEKGYITHTIDGRTFVYDTAAPRGQVAARAVRRIVDWICNGSVEEVLVGMVDQNMIDWKQLRMLADKRGRPKRGRK
jgi:predicted transcriptional regulator